jgi:hypothetical protein
MKTFIPQTIKFFFNLLLKFFKILILVLIFLFAFIFHLISLDEEYKENSFSNDNVLERKIDTDNKLEESNDNNKILSKKEPKRLLEIDDDYEYEHNSEIISDNTNNNTINNNDEKQIHDIIDHNYKAH